MSFKVDMFVNDVNDIDTVNETRILINAPNAP
jgi:hypothetical protein